MAFDHGFLYGRADGDSDPSDPGLQCTRFCEVSLGGNQGPRSLDRRFSSPCGLNHASARSVHQPLFLDVDGNENATEFRLAKREFTPINDNEEAARHVISVLNGRNPPPGFFATGTPAAVQYVRKFEKRAFSYGTGGLHGCTMVAIISKRALYMVDHCSQNRADKRLIREQAHFWETYSTRGSDDDTGTSRQQFLERVNNALKGVSVARPYNPPDATNPNERIARNHRYVPPSGPPM